MFAKNQTFSLPEPTKVEIERSIELIDYLLTLTPMPFKDFMDNCLFYKDLGYYTSCDKKFGIDGDFVTAPEISKIFSFCIANFFKDSETILEIGAGSGKMCSNIISFLKKKKKLKKYIIVEISENLIKNQKKFLKENHPDFFHNISWEKEVPNNFEGNIVANELLDAMPIDRYLIKDDTVYEQYVDFDKRFFYKYIKINSNELIALKNKFFPDEQEYFVEIQKQAMSFVKQLEKKLKKGTILLIDYGFNEKEFFHPMRKLGTLMCHYKHFNHSDPLIYPGLQDITAHINFSSIIKQLHFFDRFSTQVNFLIDSNLEEIVNDNELSINEKHGLNTITSHAEMGDLCKALIIKK